MLGTGLVIPYLNERTKSEVTKCLERLVNFLRPIDLGFKNIHKQLDLDVDQYCEKIVTFLKTHDDALSGEKLFVELTSKKKKAAITFSLGPRLKTSLFTAPDWLWVLAELKRYARVRKYGDYTQLGSRIVADSDNHVWVTWKTEDCVFAALLKVMGLKFKGTGGLVEAAEETVERRLAEIVGVPRQMVQDELLRLVIEEELGWTPVAGVTDIDTLNANTANGTYYLISYCTNAETDAWHVVLGLKGSGLTSWTIFDRQKERVGKKGALVPSGEAVAWEVDAESGGVNSLKIALEVDTLRVTYEKMID